MTQDDPPAGVEFARYVRCYAEAGGDLAQALEVARQHYPDDQRLHQVLEAAAESAASREA